MYDEENEGANQRVATNWCVVTGGPSSGKTTTVNLLAARGYKTTIEHARHYLDTKRAAGKTVGEIRGNQREFQLGVLRMQIEQEASLSPEDLVFLDRALPDARAYYRFLGLTEDPILTAALKSISYRRVFILDPLTLVNDYARTEDVEAQCKIHDLIVEVYSSFPFPIIHVPVLPQETRVNLILANI